jgi:hypothetical protein
MGEFTGQTGYGPQTFINFQPIKGMKAFSAGFHPVSRTENRLTTLLQTPQAVSWSPRAFGASAGPLQHLLDPPVSFS